ncbi:MAG: sodium:calcium antiporter [Oscillospiraceae bacterium]|nr:sodium:calcium antiporter [Oscillospiraceae bacterium]
MLVDIIFTAGSLAFILFACFIFTNAIEWFGEKLNVGQGIVGSIFSAIGTALPETVIPLIAIFLFHDQEAKDIGVGAIAGAPFMLGTLALFVTGTAVIIYSLIGKRTVTMNVDVKVISTDLSFFLVIYTIAVLTTLIHSFIVIKNIIAVLLLLSYIIYIRRALANDSGKSENLDRLLISRVFKVKTNLFWICVQLLAALAGIIAGAQIFVANVRDLANIMGVAPLILSIIITPIATELPEKFNSVIWTGKKKDTLAVGNITGAMVFQSCFPVVIGMLFTPWDLKGITLVSAIIAIASAVINLAYIKLKKAVNPFVLLFGGVFYAGFLVYVFG